MSGGKGEGKEEAKPVRRIGTIGGHVGDTTAAGSTTAIGTKDGRLSSSSPKPVEFRLEISATLMKLVKGIGKTPTPEKVVSYLRSTFFVSDTQFRGTGAFSVLPNVRSAYVRPPSLTKKEDDDFASGGWEWDNHPALPALVRITCKSEATFDPVTRQRKRGEFIRIYICAPAGQVVNEHSDFRPAEPWFLESLDIDKVAFPPSPLARYASWPVDPPLPIQAYHDFCLLTDSAPALHLSHVKDCRSTLPTSIAETVEANAFVKRILEPWTISETRNVPVAGVLLWGPPGTGKTTFAQTTLAGAGVRILWSGTAPELSSKWIGETEKRLKQLFESSLQTPHLLCAIIIDEIDTLVASRGSSSSSRSETKVDWTSVMLSLMDARRFPNLVVVGTTNRKTTIEPAFLRSKRMSQHFFFGRLLVQDRLAALADMAPNLNSNRRSTSAIDSIRIRTFSHRSQQEHHTIETRTPIFFSKGRDASTRGTSHSCRPPPQGLGARPLGNAVPVEHVRTPHQGHGRVAVFLRLRAFVAASPPPLWEFVHAHGTGRRPLLFLFCDPFFLCLSTASSTTASSPASSSTSTTTAIATSAPGRGR